MMILSGGVWVWAVIIQHKYQRNRPALDWGNAAFGEGWGLYVFQQIEFALKYDYEYWLMGFLAKKPEEIVRYSSVARGVEAAGQCVASGISSTKTPLIVSACPILAWWGIALPLAFLVVRRVGIDHVGAEGCIPKAYPSENETGSADNEPPKV